MGELRAEPADFVLAELADAMLALASKRLENGSLDAADRAELELLDARRERLGLRPPARLGSWWLHG